MKNYFNDSKKEFIIEDMFPIRPLINYIWNETSFIEINHFGFGTSKACINKRFRNVVNGIRLVYVKEEDGTYFDINRNYNNLPYDKFLSHVGLGYQKIESLYHNIESSLTILLPKENNVELHRITVKNLSNETKNIFVYPYTRPSVNLNGHLAYGKGCYDNELGGLYYNFIAFDDSNPYKHTFYKCTEKPSSYATNDREFIGEYGSLERPIALKNEKLSNLQSAFVDNYCACYQIPVSIKPQEEKEIYVAVGIATSKEESIILANKYANKNAFIEEFNNQIKENEKYLDCFTVKTPDSYLNSLVNIWLKRQVSLGKTWGRIYGKGFRDVLQDITGFVSFDYNKAKERISYTLKHQFISGNGLRQFDPIFDYPYQDMPVWIPMAILSYVKESGDFTFLNEEVEYYDDNKKESVFSHLKRGVDYLYNNQGEHGLGLWGGGDWNDSMNNCGLQMKGESVWLSIATVKATNDYIELLERISFIDNVEEIIAQIKDKKEKLVQNIIKYGFEKDHFIYGINDWGEKVGSYDCKEGKTYLNPQTWAIISGIFDKEKGDKLLDHVENNLKCDYGYVQNVPSYTKGDEHIGRVSYFGDGLYENGSVYNHGVMFKIVADCIQNRGDNAYETLKMLRYNNPKNANSGTEPYAISNMYFGPCAFARKGYAPYSWTTGSASWMYRAITEFMLGIKADFDGLIIDYCLPSTWDNVYLKRVFRGAIYEIEFIKDSNKKIVVDGVEIKGNKVPVFSKNTTHKVLVYF